MAELKTQKTKESVTKYIDSIEDEQKRKDSKVLYKLMLEATGEKAAMWGTSIVGFGQYHYESERSAQKGDWPLAGFSPRKQNLTVYIMPGFQKYESLLKKLGKYKVSGGSCLYIKKLADVDLDALKELVKISTDEMRKKYNA